MDDEGPQLARPLLRSYPQDGKAANSQLQPILSASSHASGLQDCSQPGLPHFSLLPSKDEPALQGNFEATIGLRAG